MKVVHVAAQHPPRDTRIFYKECRSLAAAGHDVTLLARDPPAEEVSGVKFVEAVPYPPITSVFGWLRGYPRCVLTNFRIARRLDAELYHFHETPLIPLAVLIKLSGRRVVFDAHEDAPREAIASGRNLGRPWLGWAYAAVCGILEGLARLLFDGFVAATPKIGEKYPPQSTAVAQNFALAEELEAFRERSRTAPYHQRENVVAYVGGLVRVRSIRELITAMEQIPSDLGARLLLAGPFSPPEFQSECESIEGWRTVDYLGFLDREHFVDTLSRARVGVVLFYPEMNHMEALPNKLFEYMAAGLPIVASDFPYWNEIFGPIGCVRFVDPRDPAAISDAVRYLLENPREAEKMGRRGREAVATRFSWEGEVAGLLDLYRRIENKGRRPEPA